MDNRDLKAKFMTGVADFLIGAKARGAAALAWVKANKVEAAVIFFVVWGLLLILVLVVK